MAPTSDTRIPFADGWVVWPWACLRSAGFPVDLVDRLAAPEVGSAVDALLDAKAMSPADASTVEARASAAKSAFDQGAVRIRRELLELAREPHLREAVAWQNRRALHTGLDRLLVKPETRRDDKTRQKELLLAKYVQRYSTKCESIGFFGPIGWATLDDKHDGFSSTPGPALVDRRTTALEYWAIAALADVLAENPALRPWLCPRLLPMARLEGRTLFVAGVRRELSVADAAIIARCDGTHTALEIAHELTADPTLDLADASAVFERLAALVQPGVLSWTLEVPLSGFGERPERSLRAILARVEDDPLRAEALRPLDELEAGTRKLSDAAGNADAVDRALGDLEESFERLTQSKATRRQGESYAGRTVAYEDCRRDVDLVIGADVLRRIARPLSLLLDSARWYSYGVLKAYRTAIKELYRQARSPHGAAVPLEAFGPALLENIPRFYPRLLGMKEHPAPVLGDLPMRLTAKWAEILRIEDGPVHRRSDDIRDAVKRTFETRGPAAAGARYHAPDVMLVASSADAVRRGELQIVLGEVHVGINTLERPFWLGHHPNPDEVLATIMLDQPQPRLTAMPPRQRAGRTGMYMTLGRDDYDFVLLDAPRPRRDLHHRVHACECVFEEDGDELFVRTRDRRARWEVGVFFGSIIADQNHTPFRILEPAPHRGRVTVDDLVLCRETWQLDANALAFANEPTELGRFAGARRLARELGLPRRAFFKSPKEDKPIYVDFESPVLVELLAKSFRGVRSGSFSEMLPGPNDTWLVDAQGRSYVSELRFVLVDTAMG